MKKKFTGVEIKAIPVDREAFVNFYNSEVSLGDWFITRKVMSKEEFEKYVRDNGLLMPAKRELVQPED